MPGLLLLDIDVGSVPGGDRSAGPVKAIDQGGTDGLYERPAGSFCLQGTRVQSRPQRNTTWLMDGDPASVPYQERAGSRAVQFLKVVPARLFSSRGVTHIEPAGGVAESLGGRDRGGIFSLHNEVTAQS